MNTSVEVVLKDGTILGYPSARPVLREDGALVIDSRPEGEVVVFTGALPPVLPHAWRPVAVIAPGNWSHYEISYRDEESK